MKQRGIFEKHPGSGVWWICYFDQFGKKRREKAGTKSVAIKLYGKRKQQVLEGKKLPENLRKPSVKFNQLLDDALAYVRIISAVRLSSSLLLTPIFTDFGKYPFSAAHFPGHSFRLIPARQLRGFRKASARIGSSPESF